MKKERKFFVAEEVFIIVRELSGLMNGYFNWSTWIQAYDAVSGFYWLQPKKRTGSISKYTHHLHMTAGSMLRAQIKHGVISRVHRGLYIFNEDKPQGPLYDCLSLKKISPHKFSSFRVP